MLQVSVNYPFNPSFVLCRDVPALYGASVNYSGYSICDNCTCVKALLSCPVFSLYFYKHIMYTTECTAL